MKTLSTLLFFVLLGSIQQGFSQNRTTPLLKQEKSTTMVYSKEEDALVYKTEENMLASEILIETLPFNRKSCIPLIVHPDLNGTCIIKKHPALLLPDYYSVTIEDKLTGTVFDLKSKETFSFAVNSYFPDRFILHMELAKTGVTAMR